MKAGGRKIKGRGTDFSSSARYLDHSYEAFDDGWEDDGCDADRPRTMVTEERARTIITRNRSPDIPFEQSINPYRGCEHGCSYCYARPAHAYMDLSPGIDFETRLFAKPNAAELLKQELGKSNYYCSPIALGANTDPYQPIEREWRITRFIIEVLKEYKHPLMIVTKSSLVERDIDLLAPMAEEGLVQVFISVTTLKHELARRLEPRATAPKARISALRVLADAGIPTGVMFAPVIPALNDTEMESVLDAATDAGVQCAGYVMLRLPHEVKQIFKQWLEVHEPLKANHVMNMLRDIRAGKENDTEFCRRLKGQGNYADIIAKRFNKACARLSLNHKPLSLDTTKFIKPTEHTPQLLLF